MKEKKEPKRISLATYIISLIIMFVVAVVAIAFILKDESDRANNNAQNNNQVSSNNIEETNNSKEENATKSNYVWEEYSEDMDKEITQWLLGFVEEDSEQTGEDEESVSYDLRKKTLYSLSKKYADSSKCAFTHMYVELTGIGDYASFREWDSNYARYCYPDNKDNDLNAKYTKKIEYNTALFNEAYYTGHYSLETQVANQEKELAKDYPNEKFYYEINKVLIMNGNNENEQLYKENGRAKKIKVTIADKEYVFELKDTNAVQEFDIDYKQNNISKPVNITVEVIDSFSGEKSEDVYISDIQFSIDSNIPQGR